MTDTQIESAVNGARLGDSGDFAKLYDLTYDNLNAYAWRRTFDHAAKDDIVSNTYIKMIETLPNFEWQSRAAFYGWLYRIAMSEISNYFRKQNKYALNEDYFSDDTSALLIDAKADKISGTLDKQDDAYRLHAAIAQLKKREQRVIELYYFADASHKDIAQTLDMKDGAVRTCMHRALKKLEKSLPNMPSLFEINERTTS